jgi:hypothetical protein
MNSARFLTFATLAATCAGILTLAMEAQPINAPARATTGLSAVRLSGAEVSDAVVLAGFALLVCSKHMDCAR